MEKKVPERKVSLHEGDIFYVYDKRINKCVKEGCNGTVKYGLILKVSMTKEEVCNCFECNKCHMKYTPYPNYVRLSDTKALTIYNHDEVKARDEKRADDAKKQALREKREQKKRFEKKEFEKKEGYRKYGNVVVKNESSHFGTRKPKPYGKKNSYGSNSGYNKGYKSYNNNKNNNYNDASHQD